MDIRNHLGRLVSDRLRIEWLFRERLQRSPLRDPLNQRFSHSALESEELACTVRERVLVSFRKESSSPEILLGGEELRLEI